MQHCLMCIKSNNMTHKNIITLPVILLMSIFCVQSSAQQQTYLNISTSSQTAAGIVLHTYGVSAEKQFKQNWSYELGINLNNFILPIENIKVNYTSLPLNFRYYSKIANFSLGAEVYYYKGWEYISEEVIFSEIYLDILKLTYNLKINKTIKLTQKFALEPEISINLFSPIFPRDVSFGAGIRVKYTL